MEDEGDESPEYITDTDKAEMSESRAATGSWKVTETVLSDDQNEEEMEVRSSIDQERHEQEPAVCERDDTIAKIAIMQYPTDPSHVEAFHIKCNDSYISVCCSVRPCQPDMT